MGDGPGALPVIASVGRVYGEHDFEAFHDGTAPLFDTYPLVDDRDFRRTTVDYLVDDVVVTRIGWDPLTLRRASGHLRDGTTDRITVQIHHHGGLRGEAGRTSLDLNPQRIGFIDFAHPFGACAQRSDVTWVVVPRARIDRADQLGAAAALERSSARGQVLDAAVAELWRQLGDARADQAPELADRIVETINTVLEPGDFTPTDRDLTAAMLDFVQANLDDLDLGVDTLQATFHWSRASVYRLFEPLGGVASYIREQRLLRCFDELSRPAKLPRQISEIATRWGFENRSHFTRLFKAEFGVVPSAVSKASHHHTRQGPHPAATTRIARFHQWVGAA